MPTFTEQKVLGLEQRDWFGIYLAGAPTTETAARVGGLVRTACSSAEYATALASGGIEAAASTPAELDRLARTDLERWAPLVTASGFVAES